MGLLSSVDTDLLRNQRVSGYDHRAESKPNVLELSMS